MTKKRERIMTWEQCNTVYQDMLTAYFRLLPDLPESEVKTHHDRLVGMLSAIRVIRGDQLDNDLMVDIVEADIRAHARGLDPALNVRWI